MLRLRAMLDLVWFGTAGIPSTTDQCTQLFSTTSIRLIRSSGATGVTLYAETAIQPDPPMPTWCGTATAASLVKHRP